MVATLVVPPPGPELEPVLPGVFVPPVPELGLPDGLDAEELGNPEPGAWGTDEVGPDG